jgi:hypothetical protein
MGSLKLLAAVSDTGFRLQKTNCCRFVHIAHMVSIVANAKIDIRTAVSFSENVVSNPDRFQESLALSGSDVVTML